MRNTGSLIKIVCFAFLSCFLAGCTVKVSVPVHIERVNVTVPGMSRKVKLAYLSDLHIATLSEEITQRDTVNRRIDWVSEKGMPSAQRWPLLVNAINESGADRVLFGGDMLDFNSRSNIEVLKEGLAELEIPFTYIRADHDIMPYYIDGADAGQYIELQKQICEYGDVYVDEYPEFVIVGWNNSTSQLTEAGMQMIREAADLGKPMILLTHVPIEPLYDKSLSEASLIIHGRDLTWSRGGTGYVPDNTPGGDASAELLELIYADDTPFTEILCGHIHTAWDGYVTKRVHEHVFTPGYEGCIGIITVSGDGSYE